MTIHENDIINSDLIRKKIHFRIQKGKLTPLDYIMLRQKCQGANAFDKNEKN